MFKVLVVDDDESLRLSVAAALTKQHYEVETARDGEEGANKVKIGNYNLVLLDVNMPKMSGLAALKEIKAHDPSIIVIVLTAFSNIRDAVEATKEGAYNYLEKPIKADNLVYIIDKALKAHSMVKNMGMSAPIIRLPGDTEFIGQSSEMKKIFEVIDKLARVETAVLIRGESGTGKELVAQALHYSGPRKDNRFVTVNCSAIPETLIESEFFGHEKGAFTGADGRKIGKFQYADGGTLFLDEIGDITAGMQVKLLRVLQEKKFTPVGANREVEVNVRIVAATNRNLEDMIKKGLFREDLFYRLNVLPIHLPPLRQRKKDIEALSKHFIDKFNLKHSKSITSITPEALDILKSHSWPGNIRELENVIEHSFVIETGSKITEDSLPESLKARYHKPVELITSLDSQAAGGQHLDSLESGAGALVSGAVLTGFRLDINKLDYHANKEEFEKQFLIAALKTFKGKINQTALHANIPKKTLLRKLEKHGINARDYTP
jgi:DNA-binding NtrC family response regulator